MVNLQASSFFNHSLSPSPLLSPPLPLLSSASSSSSSSSRQRVYSSLLLPCRSISCNSFSDSRFRLGHRSSSFSSLPCTLHPDYGNFNSESVSSPDGNIGSGSEDLNAGGFGDQGADFDGNRTESSESGIQSEKEGKWRNLPFAVFLMGLWAATRMKFQKVIEIVMDWCCWWTFWRQEKRLKRLTAEADANPKDAAKQSALLVELNKKSPESVIRRFEQRDHAVDSKGVVEYLRALVLTDEIADYLPDSDVGRPSTLSTLLQELKQRDSGNVDEPFVNPGISDKKPLHVVLVNPKVAYKSRILQDLISTIIFTVAVGLVWFMGATALQKYIGSFGGIGTLGIDPSSLYALNEFTKEYTPEKTSTGKKLGQKYRNVKTFKDVKGCDDAKRELEEVVEYLKNPSKFTRLGGKLPKGILLTGDPGTGKTLLAKAIAGEAGVPFFYKPGSEFEELFVGIGARRVKSLFQVAKKKAPCIIFIDEIDAIGSTRKQWEGQTKKTLHQLLVEMDGFEQNEIVVRDPDVRGRQEILELYLQDTPLDDSVDVKAIARGTSGFNGADLANMVNIAAIKAAVEGAEKLNNEQLEFAKDRIVMGTERKTMFIPEESKMLTAYHESGHAIVAFNTDGAHPIYKATIMPRGSSLGMVTQLPPNDDTSVSRKQLLARLDVSMGGRVAEEIIFGHDHITTRASSDLHKATELAQYMVAVCGMSESIGPVHIRERPSAELQSCIDVEVVSLLKDAYDRVTALLKKHENALHALSSALLEHETLSAEEIKRILLSYRNEQVELEEEEDFMSD
ncbi:ATP-dependent zinc metalloprotease FTSH 11, chloroplastic/mitochondrial, partial [Cucurbita argyrosperma subsp. sororia]